MIPSYMHIPLDDEDCQYSYSFSVDQCDSEETKSFFETFGFLIFRDVLSPEECSEVEKDMADFLHHHGKGITNFGVPKGVNAIFRPALLRLRQKPTICQVFESILGTPKFVVNHDRWLWHKAPQDPNKPLSKRNLHLDLNPWDFFGKESIVQDRLDRLEYGRNDRAFISENNDVHLSMQPCIQSLVNLSDLTDSSHGGTILVPGSHKTFQDWLPSAHVQQRQDGPIPTPRR